MKDSNSIFTDKQLITSACWAGCRGQAGTGTCQLWKHLDKRLRYIMSLSLSGICLYLGDIEVDVFIPDRASEEPDRVVSDDVVPHPQPQLPARSAASVEDQGPGLSQPALHEGGQIARSLHDGLICTIRNDLHFWLKVASDSSSRSAGRSGSA